MSFPPLDLIARKGKIILMKLLVLISFACYLFVSTFPNWGNAIEIDLNESIGVASKYIDFDKDGKIETTTDKDQKDNLQLNPKPDLIAVLNNSNFSFYTTLLKVIFFPILLLPTIDFQQTIEIPPIFSPF